MPQEIQSAYGVAKVEKLIFGGSGLFRDPTWGVCFVEDVLPGETIRFRIDIGTHTNNKKQNKRSFHNAFLVEVLEASPQRVSPECPHYKDCGGCDWQHISYEMQSDLKRDIVIESLERLASEAPKASKFLNNKDKENSWIERMQVPVSQNLAKAAQVDIEADINADASKNVQADKQSEGSHWSYRQRAKFYATEDQNGHITLGFRRKGSHDTVAVPQCKILSPAIVDAVYGSSDFLPDAETQVPVYIFAGETVSAQEFSYRTTLNAVDKKRYLESDKELSIKGQARLFFQSNAKVLPLLLEELQIELKPLLAKWQGAFLDLYAGVGLFSLCMDPLLPASVPRFAVEHSKAAFRYLQENLAATSYQCYCKDVASFLRSDKLSDALPNVLRGSFIFADPPRGGMSAEIAQLCNDSDAKYILYLSCDAASFARDVARLSKYCMLSWRLVDFYPQTHHIELYALFQKIEAKPEGLERRV